MKKRRHGIGRIFVFITLFFPISVEAESLRVFIAGSAKVSMEESGKTPVSLSYTDSVLVFLDEDIRFFRAVELEFTAPQSYIPFHGSLAVAIYADLDKIPDSGVVDIQARQIFFEPIPNKILNIFQIPLKQAHSLKSTPYASVLPDIILPSSFPLLFRILPVVKGLSEEIESMNFSLYVKPVPSNEGAVRLVPRYPENLRDRPFTVLIDDLVIENPGEERMLREGEHHLVILSNDYRNENRVFMVERGKTLELTVALQDPTPLVIFEAPENAFIFFDNQPVTSPGSPMPVEPGIHEVKFQISDYSIIKSLTIQKGKTYRVSMAVDVQVSESD
ncbi:MAG: hypothetical protein LBU18_03040 [Treponema sp.]|jgi:hypothetical protein|nr:hypothetical protein [Treponema sp.]